MREISLLIDSGQAKFNLSTLLTINYLHTDEDISMAIVFKERSDPVDGQYLARTHFIEIFLLSTMTDSIFRTHPT